MHGQYKINWKQAAYQMPQMYLQEASAGAHNGDPEFKIQNVKLNKTIGSTETLVPKYAEPLGGQTPTNHVFSSLLYLSLCYNVFAFPEV